MKNASFTLKQQIELFEFKEKNPKESYANIGKIFGAKWGKDIGRVTVYQICKRIGLDQGCKLEFKNRSFKENYCNLQPRV